MCQYNATYTADCVGASVMIISAKSARVKNNSYLSM